VIALGVPDSTAAGWLPVAGVAAAVTALVVVAARERVKDVDGMGYHAAKEQEQQRLLASAVWRSGLAAVLAAAACLTLSPVVVSVVHAALEAPRAWSTVKAVLLCAYGALLTGAGFAAADCLRALSARTAWRQERDAVRGPND
jgi:hypothetical protein